MQKNKFTLLILACLLGIIPPASGQFYTIHTIAGGGSSLGDGGSANSANLLNPTSTFLDATGNLFIADWLNNRVRKVTPMGIITTVAGNGKTGFSGDGGQATNAELYGPVSVYVDAIGNIYITDNGNARIRKVDLSGTITTIAGNGTYGYTGDGGPALNASFKSPTQVAGDKHGNLYISDVFNHCIRKIDSTGNISTIAGNGSPGFSGDGGLASVAQLFYPSSIAIDDMGNIFIADAGNCCIRKIDISGKISTVAGNHTAGFSGDYGFAVSAQLYYPSNVTVDKSGNLYISDAYSARIRMVNTNGTIFTIAGNGIEKFSGDGSFASEASIYNPYQATVDNNGNIYFADMFNNRIRELSPDNSNPNLEKQIVIFPDPNKGAFTISVPGFKTNLQLEIYNVLGQNVYEASIISGLTQINISPISSGIYLYRVTNSSVTIGKGKFLIN